MNKLYEKAGKTAIGLVAAGMMAASLGGCATPPTDPGARAEFEQINDPMEPLNRYFFELNRFLDFILLHPWADTYNRIVPETGRTHIHNALDNVGNPLNVVNEALQGRGTDSVTTIGRFLVNSTLGIGGLFDVATDFGLPAKKADFGQTLYVWGLPEGPYMVLPIFGPSNPRDGVGLGVDSYADPVGWVFKLQDLSRGQRRLDRRSGHRPASPICRADGSPGKVVDRLLRPGSQHEPPAPSQGTRQRPRHQRQHQLSQLRFLRRAGHQDQGEGEGQIRLFLSVVSTAGAPLARPFHFRAPLQRDLPISLTVDFATGCERSGLLRVAMAGEAVREFPPTPRPNPDRPSPNRP